MDGTFYPTALSVSMETAMSRHARKPPALPSALAGLLLLTASCGDLQDPASDTSAHITASPDAQAPYLTRPSLNPSSEPAPDGPASMPAPTPSDPGLPISNPPPAQAQDTPGINEPSGNLPSSQPVPPATAPSADGSGSIPPWQTRESPIIKSVTLSWDPSASGNADGYRVYVTGDSTVFPYYVDAGPATQLAMTLLAGHRYAFTVVAYNAAGESPPAHAFTFNVN